MRTLILFFAVSLSTAHAQVCDVIEGAWRTQPSLHRSVQTLAPTASGATTAATLFARAISQLKILVTLYHPTVWPHLTARYAVTPDSTEARPVAHLKMTFRFGPWGFQGAVPIQYSYCGFNNAATGTSRLRVQFDLRRATGDLRGVISAMRINFSAVDAEDSTGRINVTSTLGILPGPGYGNHGEEMEDFLRKQIYPFMDALRTQYINVRDQAEFI